MECHKPCAHVTWSKRIRAETVHCRQISRRFKFTASIRHALLAGYPASIGGTGRAIVAGRTWRSSGAIAEFIQQNTFFISARDPNHKSS